MVQELESLKDRVDDALATFLTARRQELEWIDHRSTTPIDEVIRLFRAGGKRLRPAFCYWGYRAAGGGGGGGGARARPPPPPPAALELLHTMALIHDDVMDGAAERRGDATAQARQTRAAWRRRDPDPERVGTAVAILAGDLAAVLADEMMLEAGFPPERLPAALERYHRMRTEMAVGAYLAVTGMEADARRLAFLKGGSYTVEGPLLIGAALAGAPVQVVARLERYGEPLGEAFQLLDDLRDGDAAAGVSGRDARKLIAESKDALDPDVLRPEAVAALGHLADQVAAQGIAR